jgi:N-acetylglucosaminyldiphosphoundecaprenol N-acetyl-beta-D-mannosaminyltransferase
MKSIRLFSIPICNISIDQATELMVKCATQTQPVQINFVNAHCVNISSRDPEYLQILQQSPYNFADGVGMRIAAAIFGQPLADNVNGTDLYPNLCESLASKDIKIFLLGGEPGVAEQMREQTRMRYPYVQFCGEHHGFFTPAEEPDVLKKIQKAQPDILLVALGVPQQEKWIARNFSTCGVKVAMGVGGLFNFYSGNIPRAPLWMRKAGIEWVHRLLQEPARLWKRYLIGNGFFLWLVIKQRLFR